jgi:hypothetical protein
MGLEIFVKRLTKRGAICGMTAFGLIFVGQIAQAADDHLIVDVPPNETVNTYLYVNLGGHVYLKILEKGGPGCVDLWWILWPFGNIRELGRHCGDIDLELPGISSFSVAGRLRARGGPNPIKIGITDKVEIANKFPKIEFP